MKVKQVLISTAKFSLLLLLFYVFFIIGSMAISGMMPDIESEPGFLGETTGFLFFGLINTLLIIGLIKSSAWKGAKLIFLLAIAYYGAVTFLTQIEAWYFMQNVTFDQNLLPRLLLMGMPIAFIYIPLAVWILGKGKKERPASPKFSLKLPAIQWFWKLGTIALLYILLYWSAGYFIAWQNADLRAFYGSPGEIVPFWEHTANTLREDPGLFPFQAVRAMVWTLCALPILLGSKLNVWWTAVLVGLFFTVPQLSGLILENPLMPIASIRASHIIEGISTNLVFGMSIVYLLHRKHSSLKDLFGIRKGDKHIPQDQRN